MMACSFLSSLGFNAVVADYDCAQPLQHEEAVFTGSLCHVAGLACELSMSRYKLLKVLCAQAYCLMCQSSTHNWPYLSPCAACHC